MWAISHSLLIRRHLKHLEAIVDTKYSDVGCVFLELHITFAPQAVLVATLLPGQFKVLVLILKALHGIGPGYLKDHFPPVVAICFISSGRRVILRVPLIKELCLVRSRRRTFLAMTPAPWSLGMKWDWPQPFWPSRRPLELDFVIEPEEPVEVRNPLNGCVVCKLRMHSPGLFVFWFGFNSFIVFKWFWFF